MAMSLAGLRPARSVVTLLEEQARRRPDAIAVAYGGSSLTFAELNGRVNQLARFLRHNGAGPDVLVGLFLDRGLDMVIALLAVAKAGAAYVPLDPRFPRARLAVMLEDAEPAIVVAGQDLAGSLPRMAATVICPDGPDAAAIARCPAGPLEHYPAPGQLAYVIFTSGSTGRPKGVQVPHLALTNLLLSFAQSLRLGTGDSWAAVTTLSFDIAALEIMLPLACGARLLVASAAECADPALLRQLLDRCAATVLQATPTTWRLLVNTVGVPGGLRTRLCGGEALAPDLAEAVSAPGAAVWNVYGPTETTVWSAASSLAACSSSTDIGPPIANTSLYVLGEDLARTAAGVAGEIWIGGRGVARGYHRRPGLTAARFRPDPFTGVPGARMYRTGDLGRRRADGGIEFLGRADQQVKIRGHRVEIGEVEEALTGHPAVAAAAVTVSEDPPGDRRLTAHVVARGRPPAERELREFLRERLPSYMLPATFCYLAELPQTPNRKLDRATLARPRPASELAVAAGHGTPSERALAAIWADVLGVADIRPGDSFAGLGGHSLVALQVGWRIQEAFGVELPLRTIFDAPSLAELALIIDNARPAAAGITAVADRSGLPLSYAQERLWFLSQLNPVDPYYNLGLRLRLRGPLDPAALAGALAGVVRRHEVLRSRFESRAGTPTLILDSSDSVPLRRIDLRHEGPARIADLAAEEMRRPFDLSRDRLLRASLLSLAPDDHVLLLTMHHIVADGWSYELLLRELGAHYAAAVSATAPPVPALAVQYPDFAAWQRATRPLDGGADELAYWKARLAGLPTAMNLPADHPRPVMLSHQAGRWHFVVPAEVTRKLRDLSRQASGTLYMTVLAAFAATLARYSGQADVAVGTPVAGRDRDEVKDLIGCFVNTVVMRADLGADPRFDALLTRVRADALDAFAHASVPFERVVEALRPVRDLSRNPLVQVLFWMVPAPGTGDEEARWGPVTVTGLEAEDAKDPASAGGSTHCDLEMVLFERGAELAGTLTYSTDLYQASTVAAMADAFTAVLTQVAERPATRVSELRLDPPAASDVPRPPGAEVTSALAESLALPEAAGAAARVLDAWWYPVPPGVVGEIFLCGPGIAGEVRGRAGATATRLVPDCLQGGAAGGRVLRTGRLGRQRFDGTVELLANDGPVGRPAPGGGPPPAVAPGQAMAVPDVVARIWADLLGVDHVGWHEDFFELGGHSLIALRMLWRIGAELGALLPLTAVFEATTVAALTRLIEEQAAPREDALTRQPRDRDLPLSHAQQRLWFLTQLMPGHSAYNITWIVHWSGQLDIRALERAVTAMVARHEILRTRYLMSGRTPRQVIQEPGPVPLRVIDLRNLAGQAQDAELEATVAELAGQPFDLATGPVFRAALVRLGDEAFTWAWVMHHIAGDEWSVDVLSRELATLYQAELDGQPARLPSLPVQYADFAAWQRARLAGAAPDADLRYWTGQLDGLPLLELPGDRPRDDQQTAGASHAFEIGPALTERLSRLSQQHKATLFMTLLAGFEALLHRHSGQGEFSVGCPVSGRTRPETEHLVGDFLNPLVIRADCRADPSFAELLARTRHTLVAAFAHRELPFELLIEQFAADRVLIRNPLFRADFQLTRDSPAFAPPGMAAVMARGSRASAALLDLSVHLIESGDGISGTVRYKAGLFDPVTIDRLMRHYVVLLEAAVADPGQRLSELPLLDAPERALVCGGWPAAGRPRPAAATVHRLFEEQADRTPAATALVHEGQSLTFAELDAQANRLAHRLRALGAGPETVVGIALERGLEMVVAVLATWKAGGAYLPLAPDYPAERLALMLTETAAPVVITQSAVLERLPLAGQRAVVIDIAAESAAIGVCPARRPAAWARPGNAAYIMYTSGSTGRPKGVVIEHASACNFARQLRWTPPGTPGRAAMNAPLTFDQSLDTLLSLCAGWTVVIVPRAAQLAPEAFFAWLDDAAIDVLESTPTQLEYWLGKGLADLPHMPAVLLVSGEAIRPALWRRLRMLERVTAYNSYGPTECTIDTTIARISDYPEPNIGRPVSDASVYVLDHRMEPVPIGVSGEVYIGGAGIARGYLSRPGLTARRFIPDPFAARPGARLYRTGDIARFLADGSLQFLGRADEQVQLRGYRIEPGEIEAVLRRCPAVREAAVVLREDEPGDWRLVAYLTAAADGSQPAGGELRAMLRQALPDYMVPSAFVMLDRLPMTANGKLDKRALPAPGPAADRPDEAAAPGTATERKLAAIWSDVLGIDRVTRDDNFFGLGGHSLLALELPWRMAEAFEAEIPLETLFGPVSLTDLASLIDSLVDRATPSATRLWRVPCGFTT